MRFVKAFGRFWYDFIIGDDWKIAAAVVVAVGLLVAALEAKLFADHALAILGAVLIAAAFATSLWIDVRPRTGPRR
jgi:uncharacterized membrane protein YccC